MFKINEYKIVFKRVWHCDKDDGICYAGRYDTKCEIYVKGEGLIGSKVFPVYNKEPSFTGIAKLHPNDRPDKIIGKKIALRNAMNDWDRISRTPIWTAFFAWVADWNTL